LILPNSLIFNRFSFKIANKYVRENASKYAKDGVSYRLKPEKAGEILRCIKKMRKIHKNWSLVEVYAGDESSVNIKL
jgi:hypothetical protein